MQIKWVGVEMYTPSQYEDSQISFAILHTLFFHSRHDYPQNVCQKFDFTCNEILRRSYWVYRGRHFLFFYYMLERLTFKPYNIFPWNFQGGRDVNGDSICKVRSFSFTCCFIEEINSHIKMSDVHVFPKTCYTIYQILWWDKYTA